MANQYINAITDLWNNGGTTFQGISLNVTDSASAADSNLLRLQVGAVTKFSVGKAGVVVAAGSITSGSDLFLASGGVINWDAADVTITHSANTLAFAGASSGYTFTHALLPSANDAAALGAAATSWSDLFLASGAVLNFDSGNAVITHSSGILTVSTGDLRVTTAGTNAASAVTVGGTQTLTGKTLTSPTITTPTLTLKNSAGPTPTAEGDIQWDSTSHYLAIGDGAATQIIAPVKSGTAVATSSGTSIDFTGIPAWVMKITIMFSVVSTTGTDDILIQIGDSGGIENSGYATKLTYSVHTAGVDGYARTDGWGIVTSADNSHIGIFTLALINAATNVWVGEGLFNRNGANETSVVVGGKGLSGVLDRVRITTATGTPTFDGGEINILYE